MGNEWWNEEITQDRAFEFLEQCKEYTKKEIEASAHDLKTRRFSHNMPKNEVPFVPTGAVIHATKTVDVWNSLRAVGSGAFGTHFVIATSRTRHKLDLLSDVPCSIFVPMDLEAAIPHAGYLSTLTWGIDLRLAGKVRPWYSPIGSPPGPVFMGEERSKTFQVPTGRIPKDFYWWENLWRTKFEGNAAKWFSYYYEVPTYDQILTLIILLRVLNAITPLDRRLIVPESATRDIDPVSPHVDWRQVRVYALDTPRIQPSPERLGQHMSLHSTIDDIASTHSDEFLTNDICKFQQWRSESDDGNLQFLLNGNSISFGAKHRLKFEQHVEEFGCDPSDVHLAGRMLAIRFRIPPDRFCDIVATLNKKIEKLHR